MEVDSLHDLSPSSPHVRSKVLLVDEGGSTVTQYACILRDAGYEVERLSPWLVDGAPSANNFDLVIAVLGRSHVRASAMLDAIRARHPELPLVLVTCEVSVKSAMKAVECGALSYLAEPVAPDTLRKTAERATHLRRSSMSLRRALSSRARELKKLRENFEHALLTLHVEFQPIVCWSQKKVVAYEAFVVNDAPGLERSEQLFQAAERLERVRELGRAVRRSVAEAAFSSTREFDIFLNVHPQELSDPELFSSDAPLSSVARRVVVDVTNRAASRGCPDVAERLTTLRELGFRLAVDDMGSGYGGLSALAELRPNVATLDMSLVRGIDQRPRAQKLVRAFISLCNELNVSVVAEGVETIAERNALLAAGCDLMRGYLFAKPGSLFSDVDAQSLESLPPLLSQSPGE